MVAVIDWEFSIFESYHGHQGVSVSGVGPSSRFTVLSGCPTRAQRRVGNGPIVRHAESSPVFPNRNSAVNSFFRMNSRQLHHFTIEINFAKVSGRSHRIVTIEVGNLSNRRLGRLIDCMTDSPIDRSDGRAQFVRRINFLSDGYILCFQRKLVAPLPLPSIRGSQGRRVLRLQRRILATDC